LLERIDDKATVVSHSYLLHRHHQFKSIFIVPDRTKVELEKHKKLVSELKQSEGETNLMIKNGNIIVRSHCMTPHQSQEQLSTDL